MTSYALSSTCFNNLISLNIFFLVMSNLWRKRLLFHLQLPSSILFSKCRTRLTPQEGVLYFSRLRLTEINFKFHRLCVSKYCLRSKHLWQMRVFWYVSLWTPTHRLNPFIIFFAEQLVKYSRRQSGTKFITVRLTCSAVRLGKHPSYVEPSRCLAVCHE